METITHNNKTLNISAPEARAIKIIAAHKIVKVSDLAEGRGRPTYSIDPTTISGTEHVNRDWLSISVYPKFVTEFFASNPRVKNAIFDKNGSAKRIASKLS